MSTGMEAIIEIPLRKRPYGLLLDAANEISGERWRSGVTFQPWGCNGFSSADADYCDFDADDLDDAFSFTSAPKFNAFEVYGTESCTSLDSDIEVINGRLMARWGVMVSEQFASRLQDELVVRSAVGSTGPLNSSELVSNAEESLALSLHGGLGLLHVSPAVLVVLAANESIRWDGSGWVTPTGHGVVSDPGHTGLAPTAHSSPTGTEWAYVTGSVVYGIGEPRLPTQANEYLDRGHNDVTGRIIGAGVVAFDPCAATAFQFGYPSYVEGS